MVVKATGGQWEWQYSAVVGGMLVVVGQVLVLGSFYRLGITGTFLGDYCGIYMEERVTGFPFNLTANPMYTGSSLSFLGNAVFYESTVGCALAGLVFLVYQIALMFEEPFTNMIYETLAKARVVKEGKKST